MSSRSVARQARCFASTSKRASILDYFKPKASTPSKPELSTKEVINKVETQEVQINTKIPIIGKRNEYRENLWKQRMLGFEVNHWIPKDCAYKELLSTENLEPKAAVAKLLLQSYNETHGAGLTSLESSSEVVLNDLQKRFELVKTLQIQFGITISDYSMTRFRNLNRVEEFLENHVLKAKKFNEKQPNAIYLELEDFEGTNITIEKFVSERQKEKKFNRLLREARKLENLENKKLLEQTLNSA